MLEYYQGILLLTTNRLSSTFLNTAVEIADYLVGAKTFDLVVQSRVNLSIHYNVMGYDDQRRLFSIFFDRIDQEDIEHKKQLLKWVRETFEKNLPMNLVAERAVTWFLVV